MKIAALLLCIKLCGITALAASQVSSDIVVAGDVPRPGPIAIDKGGMTLEAAVAKAGLDLRQYDLAEIPMDAPCPVRVILHRAGRSTIYEPQEDGKLLETTQVLPLDTIEVKDFAKRHDTLAGRTKRLGEMIILGSFEVGDEIIAIAGIRRECLWLRGNPTTKEEPMDVHIYNEVTRLTEEGLGEKVVKLLELRRSALMLDGLASGHPKVKETDQLLKMLNEAAQTIKKASKPAETDDKPSN